ncbi:MAG: MYG1 family protein [Candidatus Pacebacteria bacterium]|nr:MYG1 family protein [Candidatus Paceibacterota bacterium]
MQTVVTHNGNFHPDDVFALATLQLHLGKENIKVIRTRDEEIIKSADWVVDVGEVYDVEAKRFDHHQKGSPERDNGIPYAAFGLVWKELGVQVCGSEEVATFIEEKLAQPIDAGDNGVSLYSLNEYEVKPFELFSVVHTFKPVWGSDDNVDDKFLEAVDFARGLIERLVASSKAGEVMMKIIEDGYNNAEDKSIIVYEESINRHALVKYEEPKLVVFKSESSGEVRWKAETVPVDYNTFDSRVDFPAEWGGLRDEELVEASGIEDAVFCHKGNFLFVAKTKEGAIAAAKMAK